MPSKRDSSDRVDYVPALCTHRPSLLPIGCAGEMLGLAADGGSPHSATENFIKPSHLEEGEVVTRFPYSLHHAEKSRPEKGLLLVPGARTRRGDTLKLPESPAKPPGTVRPLKSGRDTAANSRGRGNNPGREGQWAAKCYSRRAPARRSRMPFTD